MSQFATGHVALNPGQPHCLLQSEASASMAEGRPQVQSNAKGMARALALLPDPKALPPAYLPPHS